MFSFGSMFDADIANCRLDNTHHHPFYHCSSWLLLLDKSAICTHSPPHIDCGAFINYCSDNCTAQRKRDSSLVEACQCPV